MDLQPLSGLLCEIRYLLLVKVKTELHKTASFFYSPWELQLIGIVKVMTFSLDYYHKIPIKLL